MASRDFLRGFGREGGAPAEDAGSGGAGESDEVELSLGLSLGGFVTDPVQDPKKPLLQRAAGEEAVAVAAPSADLLCTSSLPSEYMEDRLRRRAMQSQRRLEAKRKRLERRNSMNSGRSASGAGRDEALEHTVARGFQYRCTVATGRDGGTYIQAVFPGGGAEKTGQFTVGDKVLATSSIFGEEIWPAAGYGQTMYCIHQRIGPLYMKMERRFGEWDGAGELTEKEIIRAERNSGVVSFRVREIQRKMEQKMQREEDPRMGLRLHKDGKYGEALEKFELSRDRNRRAVRLPLLATMFHAATQNSTAYVTSPHTLKMDRGSATDEHSRGCSILQIQAGLSALEDALKAGYEDFKDNAISRLKEREVDQQRDNLTCEEKNDVFLKSYKEVIGCKTTRMHGLGYLAKYPKRAQLMDAQIEQSRASSATQEKSKELEAEVQKLKEEFARQVAERDRLAEENKRQIQEEEQIKREELREQVMEDMLAMLAAGQQSNPPSKLQDDGIARQLLSKRNNNNQVIRNLMNANNANGTPSYISAEQLKKPANKVQTRSMRGQEGTN
ncbi:hypothetical protein U9M48_004411 [Paspalum notatum var. saurae]|uniref:PDZ domain-containing protein n=1 Tax=Paspalum notatum var. saurae TaxID=547442 RepID=A0AAQ3PVI5_PASNO